jgi:hypothetical protein
MDPNAVLVTTWIPKYTDGGPWFLHQSHHFRLSMAELCIMDVCGHSSRIYRCSNVHLDDIRLFPINHNFCTKLKAAVFNSKLVFCFSVNDEFLEDADVEESTQAANYYYYSAANTLSIDMK